MSDVSLKIFKARMRSTLHHDIITKLQEEIKSSLCRILFLGLSSLLWLFFFGLGFPSLLWLLCLGLCRLLRLFFLVLGSRVFSGFSALGSVVFSNFSFLVLGSRVFSGFPFSVEHCGLSTFGDSVDLRFFLAPSALTVWAAPGVASPDSAFFEDSLRSLESLLLPRRNCLDPFRFKPLSWLLFPSFFALL